MQLFHFLFLQTSLNPVRCYVLLMLLVGTANKSSLTVIKYVFFIQKQFGMQTRPSSSFSNFFKLDKNSTEDDLDVVRYYVLLMLLVE